jgi:hypothetical protein
VLSESDISITNSSANLDDSPRSSNQIFIVAITAETTYRRMNLRTSLSQFSAISVQSIMPSKASMKCQGKQAASHPLPILDDELVSLARTSL